MSTTTLLELVAREKGQALRREAEIQHLLWEARQQHPSYWQRVKEALGTELVLIGQRLKTKEGASHQVTGKA